MLSIAILAMVILIPQETIAQYESVPFSIEYDGDGNHHSILLPIAIPPETPPGEVTFNFTVHYEIIPYGESWTSEVSFSMTSSSGDTILSTMGPNLPGSSDDNVPIIGVVNGTYTTTIDDIGGGFYINVQDNFNNPEIDGQFFGFMEYAIPFPCVVGTPCDDNDPNTTNDQLDVNCNCMGTVVVTPPEIQQPLNIIPNDNCGETNNVYGDVLSDVLPLHFRLFSRPDGTPLPPDAAPDFDINGEPSIPGMTLLTNVEIPSTQATPSTTFCIENLPPGRYYLLVWDGLFYNYDIECFIVPPALEVTGPAIVPQDKTGKKHNAYLFAEGGVEPYRYRFYECPDSTVGDFQPETNADGSPDLSGMTEIEQEHVAYNGFLCIQNVDEGRHYVLIEDSAGRWKWICYETPKELQATLEDFIPAWEGDTRVYVDVCGGEPDYHYDLFICPDPAPDVLPAPEYAADGTPIVAGMTHLTDYPYTQVTSERICLDLPPGIYYLLVRDSGGRCKWVCIDIPVVEPLETELLEIVPFDCEHIRVYVRVTGGLPPYNHLPYTCPYPGTTPPAPTFPDGLPHVPDMEPFPDYEWQQNDPNTFCFTFPKDLENIYILFWGQAFCWDWVCIDFDDVPMPDCPNEYCIPVGQNSSVSWIEQVTFCDINNPSGNDGGYINYTSMIGNVVAGQTQHIFLDAQFNQLQVGVRWYVWIDFNQDNIFDANERVVNYQGGVTPIFAPITIPADATFGQTRMRVKMVTGRSLGANPCANNECGEVEDYTVNISSGTGLVAPPSGFGNPNLYDMDLETLSTQQSINTNRQPPQLSGDTYLGQNQPNPFNSNTLIKYNVPTDATDALVNVFDSRGQLIHSEVITNTGRGEIQLKAGTIAAGTYSYSLVVNGNIVDIKRMVIVK